MSYQLPEYIYREQIRDSCNWVVLRTLFIFVSKSGKVSYEQFAEHFCRYYQRRLNAGLLADSPGTQVSAIKQFTPQTLKNFIKEEAIANLKARGFIQDYKRVKDKEYIGFNESSWHAMSDTQRAMLLAAIEDKLEAYFTQQVAYPTGLLPVPCIFCDRDELKIVKENELAFSVFDIFPAVPGHCLIIPKRHVRDVFGLYPEEIGAMLQLLQEMQVILKNRYQPDGYNVGFNVGYAAGQTVMHAHMHCFPRKWGDVDNPRGGMRNIIPNWFKCFEE